MGANGVSSPQAHVGSDPADNLHVRSNPWAAIVVGVVLSASCSGGGSQEAKDALAQAVDRTLSADSFHVESVVDLPDGRQGGELDYVAPDRYRMRGFGEGAAITIQIGRDTFSTGPDDLNRFFKYENPCDIGIGGYFPALEIVGLAEHVERNGEAFVFTVDGEGNPEGEARIEDGYIVFLVVRYDLTHLGGVEERHTLSGFNSDIRIDAPPSSQVEEESSPDGGLISMDEGEPADCSTVWEPPG
jgi:hypothetical protein